MDASAQLTIVAICLVIWLITRLALRKTKGSGSTVSAFTSADDASSGSVPASRPPPAVLSPQDQILALMESFVDSERSTDDHMVLAIPALDASDYRYRRVGGETLYHVVEGVSRVEMKSTGRVASRGFAFSIPIVKGVRYRVNTGKIAAQKKMQVTDRGRLVITDKAVSFEGGNKNDRLTWTQIADIDFSLDGITVMRRTGAARMFAFDSEDYRASAIMMLLLRHD